MQIDTISSAFRHPTVLQPQNTNQHNMIKEVAIGVLTGIAPNIENLIFTNMVGRNFSAGAGELAIHLVLAPLSAAWVACGNTQNWIQRCILAVVLNLAAWFMRDILDDFMRGARYPRREISLFLAGLLGLSFVFCIGSTLYNTHRIWNAVVNRDLSIRHRSALATSGLVGCALGAYRVYRFVNALPKLVFDPILSVGQERPMHDDQWCSSPPLPNRALYLSGIHAGARGGVVQTLAQSVLETMRNQTVSPNAHFDQEPDFKVISGGVCSSMSLDLAARFETYCSNLISARDDTILACARSIYSNDHHGIGSPLMRSRQTVFNEIFIDPDAPDPSLQQMAALASFHNLHVEETFPADAPSRLLKYSLFKHEVVVLESKPEPARYHEIRTLIDKAPLGTYIIRLAYPMHLTSSNTNGHTLMLVKSAVYSLIFDPRSGLQGWITNRSVGRDVIESIILVDVWRWLVSDVRLFRVVCDSLTGCQNLA